MLNSYLSQRMQWQEDWNNNLFDQISADIAAHFPPMQIYMEL